MAGNPHEGHRKRLKNELLQHDFPETTPPHKILEALLFYGIPRKDTNLIAHDLIEKFGCFSGVFEADPNDLLQIKGMTENAVTLIKMIMPIARRIHIEKYKSGYRFSSIDEFGEHLVKRYYGYNNEMIIISGFDSGGNLVCDEIVAVGDSANVSLSVKSIVKIVLRTNSNTVIVSHNHINGPAIPSISDIEMTQSLKYTLEQINVRLLDHIIVSGDDYVSIKQSADYNNIF